MNPDDIRSLLLPVVVDLTNPPPLRPFEVNELLVLDDRLEARFINYKAGLRSWAMVFVTNAVQPHMAEVQVSRLRRNEVTPTPPVSRSVQESQRLRRSAGVGGSFTLTPGMGGAASQRPEPPPDVSRLQADALRLGGDLTAAIVEAFGLTPDMVGEPNRNPRPEPLRAPPEEEKVEVVVVAEFNRKVEL